MKYLRYLSLIFIFIFPAGVLHARESAGDSQVEPYNIIFIMADDLGWGELGSYGNLFNETPNLNELTKQGIKFNHAYAAAPICSPTRASIITGQYPARVGITDYLAPKSIKYLDPSEHFTINEALARVGYKTGMIGKWHLDTKFKDKNGSPQKHGFDEVIGTETKYIAGGDYFYPYDKINTFSSGEEDEFLTDRLSEEAVNFIQRNNDSPFFLYLSFYSVHTILDAPEKLVEKYKEKFNKKYGAGSAELIFEGQDNPRHEADHPDNPYLAAMLERIDAGIGNIMEELEKQGLTENTLLVFYSDNGGAYKVANNGHLRSYKGGLYEGGIRVPLLIRLPGKIKPGIETDVPVSSIDFYPTFLELAGAKVPVGNKTDGISLLPLITGMKTPERNDLYWHYLAETGTRKDQAGGAIRKGDYKLIETYKNNKIELYNLRTDPQEMTDLSELMPEKTKELLTILRNWKIEVGAEEFVPN